MRLCHERFEIFFNIVWSFSIALMEGEFIPGEHINEWCALFQKCHMLSIKSARKHSKSEIAHAYLAWRIFNMDYAFFEKWQYFSYTGDLAGEHLEDTKERIKVNPMFQHAGISDCTDAKTILYYRKGSKRLLVKPAGITSFKRGKHPDGVITDDILCDPERRLDISQIEKVTKIFLEQVMSLPKEGGLGVRNVGTPQDEQDLFATLEGKKQFVCKTYTARVDYKTKTSLWPGMFPWKRLDEIEFEEIGEKAFSKEFMCVPVRSTEGYFLKREIDEITFARLKNYHYSKKVLLNEYTYGGLDIGKKRHPSHLSIFGKDRKGRAVQIFSYWMDNVDYVKQLDICRWVIENFKVQRLYYDDTRAEFEGFKEVGQLPPEMKGMPFTAKKKFQIAAEFGKMVKNKMMMLLSDKRQQSQILNCDNGLKSIETQDGHGDSFWSNALACHAMQEKKLTIRTI